MDSEEVNKTEISTTPERAMARTYLHRDYLAHSIRYSFALKVIKRGMAIADIGCGRNYMLKAVYSNMLKPKIFLAIDIRRNSVQKAIDFKTNFPVVGQCMDIRKDKIGWHGQDCNNLFDIITCFEVVEHFGVKYLPHTLNEIYRVLKVGGLLLLSTPNFLGRIYP